MKLLHTYNNGTYTVNLYEDGSKERILSESANDFIPEIPESIDVKITDWCDLNCKFCHEKSTVSGKHSELDLLLELTKDCPAGVELAIGGGNPLAHPDLYTVLSKIAAKGIILNLTVNQEHLLRTDQYILLQKLIKEKVIRGVGLSITDNFAARVMPKIAGLRMITDNIVFHVIAGVNNVKVLSDLHRMFKSYKVLVLGYKTYGRGENYFNVRPAHVTANIKQWYIHILSEIEKNTQGVTSFDNLAIKQLNVRRLFTSEDSWNSFYLGDDGRYTFYIDLVDKKFAKSSTSPIKFDILKSNIDMFNFIRNSENV